MNFYLFYGDICIEKLIKLGCPLNPNYVIAFLSLPLLASLAKCLFASPTEGNGSEKSEIFSMVIFG